MFSLGGPPTDLHNAAAAQPLTKLPTSLHSSTRHALPHSPHQLAHFPAWLLKTLLPPSPQIDLAGMMGGPQQPTGMDHPAPNPGTFGTRASASTTCVWIGATMGRT